MHNSSNESTTLAAGLYIVATPIGNLGDITERAKATLSTASEIWAEDTRNAKKLLRLLDIPLGTRKVHANHDHNEQGNIDRLHNLIKDGGSIALISDAGMPIISDPGFRLIVAAQEDGHYVTVIPGASAVTTALALSGAPSDRFAFYGFAPNKDTKRTAFYADIASHQMTAIVFESPKRVNKSLHAIKENFLDTTVVSVIRELTKKFETHIRGEVKALIADYADHDWRGEIVIVIDPVEPRMMTDHDLEIQLRAVLKTQRLNDAVREIAKATGRSKNEIYQLALTLKETS